jgi:hypothetical protein
VTYHGHFFTKGQEMTITKSGVPLTSLTEWQKLAGPKSANAWVDGRSAKEAARAWLEGSGRDLPLEVSSALAKHPAFGTVEKWDAEPEVRLHFDKFAGETRNSDVVAFARDSHGPFIIAVEAKADEPFSETVAKALAASVERYLKSEKSNGVARIKQLAQALFGPREEGDPSLDGIRYQLLTACAGAICEAERRGIDRALVLVHEFVTDVTLNVNHLRNTADLNAFTKRISHGAVIGIHDGDIEGPFSVPGVPLFADKVRLFIGKVSRNLRKVH